MPTELPGFYWDEGRNRYFPISSRPKDISLPAEVQKTKKQAKTDDDDQSRREHRRLSFTPWQITERSKLSRSYMETQRGLHENLCFQYGTSSRMKQIRMPTFGQMRAFHFTRVHDEPWRIVGDDQGWLYSDKQHLAELNGISHSWSADWNLQPSCPISSISVSDTHCVSTCLGPGKFSVQDMTEPDRTYLLNLNGVSDIRASHIQQSEVVLGAGTKIVYIPDIDLSGSPQYIRTKSDVFSVVQKQRLVYAGTRNGAVERFDMRVAKHKSQRLFDSRFGQTPRSSVLYLNTIGEYELLLSHLNGDLTTFDLRFSESRSKAMPLRIFEGHNNTYMYNLGIAIDVDEDFLFAAGQDSHIRGWSLRTGLPLLPPSSSSLHPDAKSNPFVSAFPSPVSVLQVVQESGRDGLCLWAACERDLYQFHLGQRT